MDSVPGTSIAIDYPTYSMIMPTSCVCVEKQGEHHRAGASNITNFDGTLLADIRNKQGVIYADVKPRETLLDRQRNPLYVERKPEFYARYS
jgi:predicted amidohydrolase